MSKTKDQQWYCNSKSFLVDAYIHENTFLAFYLKDNKSVMSIEILPNDYPSTTIAIWKDLKAFYENIRWLDWIVSGIRDPDLKHLVDNAKTGIETEYKNEMIAKFLGWKWNSDLERYETSYLLQIYIGDDPEMNSMLLPREMLFHYSWQWLIPALKKAKEICLKETVSLDIVEINNEIQKALLTFDIKKVYNKLITFIKYYNGD